MPTLRVLVANEPRSYRDVVAALLHSLRPHLDVLLAEPDQLDHAVLTHAPDLVLCSRVTQILLNTAPHWVLLYPNGAGLVVASIGGCQRTTDDLDAAHLLALVDETAEAMPTRSP
jgi:hypothetical protein